jgi:hypothetical protein
MPIPAVVVPRRAGQFLRGRVRLYLALSIVGIGSILGLAIAGFWWWPLALIGLPLSKVVMVLFDGGGRYDPTPWLIGLRGEEAVARVLLPLEARDTESCMTSRARVATSITLSSDRPACSPLRPRP